ncbi:hypothetical protein BDP55DRAFT_667044 [Colletotrichum godetiae]|uniref:Uncharacterized protein n=1 Tax=Colletotrichum godetiae TaxID=1209918 RepID=A0AAJ0EUS0_9PEZI|nr:uncharacterized protein BDP55DRAFT_667044 [Colletotrichum godetiae]KAK1674633.1 hypothetical protein BDP55DRAFT_667044 [Colletotrichum godetiae]
MVLVDRRSRSNIGCWIDCESFDRGVEHRIDQLAGREKVSFPGWGCCTRCFQGREALFKAEQSMESAQTGVLLLYPWRTDLTSRDFRRAFEQKVDVLYSSQGGLRKVCFSFCVDPPCLPERGKGEPHPGVFVLVLAARPVCFLQSVAETWDMSFHLSLETWRTSPMVQYCTGVVCEHPEAGFVSWARLRFTWLCVNRKVSFGGEMPMPTWLRTEFRLCSRRVQGQVRALV